MSRQLNNYELHKFAEVLERFLQSLNNELPASINQIIQIQMRNLKLLPPILPETAMLELPRDQYHALSIISTYMGRNDNIRWPYYFITGLAGTRKLYVINMIINILNN